MSNRLPSDKAETILREMLANAGLNPDSLDLDKAWDVLIEFCRTPIESRTDGIVVLWGPMYKSTADAINEGEKTGFSYSLIRQFDDESHEYQNLILEWRYRLDNKLENVDDDNTDWCFIDLGFDCRAFLQAQRHTKLFQHLKHISPYETLLYQEKVDQD